MKYFDRHANMNADTRHEILHLQCELTIDKGLFEEVKWELSNYLVGLFDGYNYVNDIRELIADMPEDNAIVRKLKMICTIIEFYPQTERPNNGVH